jgi:transposase-like protein
MMTRRRFTAVFKAKVALEALRGDKTIQEIATKHKVHPNQVSAWKRRAMDGLGEVFSNVAERSRSDRETEVKERRHHLYSRSAGLSVSGRGQP